VATRWPLRDDDAAFLMERFYEALASGASVDGALRSARRDALAQGLPAAAWAGVTTLGDGARRPIAATPARVSRLAPWAAAAGGLAGLIVVAYVARRLRS
jgi:hypothetical protein